MFVAQLLPPYNVTAPLAVASSLPDGRAAVIPVDPKAFADELERLGETAGWNALFAAAGPDLQALLGLVGGGLDRPEAETTPAGLLCDRCDGALPFGQLLSDSAVDLVCGGFKTEELRSLAAPWPLHIGAGPKAPTSALWAAFALAAVAAGVPTRGVLSLVATRCNVRDRQTASLVCDAEGHARYWSRKPLSTARTGRPCSISRSASRRNAGAASGSSHGRGNRRPLGRETPRPSSVSWPGCHRLVRS